MGIPVISKSQGQRIGNVLDWAEGQMGLVNAEPTPTSPNQSPIFGLRGFLLQNIYGGGSGLMVLAYRGKVNNAVQISIVGKNYVAGSQFKIKLTGSVAPTTSQPNPPAVTLFTSMPIDVDSEATTLAAKLYQAAITANLPVKASDFTVTLGNPYSSADLISTPDIVIPDGSDPQSFIGSWVIYLTGALTVSYATLDFAVVQDNTTYMRGASALVTKPTLDLAGTTTKVVFDVQNRPPDYPWVAGSLCGIAYYADLGYGIVWSDFRSQQISFPTSSS